jgi:hypothetical protein
MLVMGVMGELQQAAATRRQPWIYSDAYTVYGWIVG